MSFELLKPSEVAEITKLSEPMIYKLISEGKLPHIRIERAVRIDRADLEEFLRQRRCVGAK